MSELLDFLKTTTVASLLSENVGDIESSSIVSAKGSDKAILTLKKMIEHQILSVPVYNEEKKKYDAFCDVLDVLAFVLKNSPGKHDTLTALEGNAVFVSTTTSEVSNMSGIDPYVPIKSTTSLLETCEVMANDYSRLHRVPVIGDDGEILYILSQSRLVKFLSKHIAEFDFGTLSIKQTNLGVQKVVSLPLTSHVKDALDAMQKHKISAVALVDAKGALIGNFSASDLRLFGYDDGVSKLANEGRTLKEFYNGIVPQSDDLSYPVTVTKATTTEEVLVKMNYAHVHRVYIVDDMEKPVGVISPVDIVQLFIRNVLIG